MMKNFFLSLVFFFFSFFTFFASLHFFLVFRQKTEAFWSEAPSSNFDDGIVLEYESSRGTRSREDEEEEQQHQYHKQEEDDD